MPGWLRVLSCVNLLTYIVDVLRALLVTSDFSHLAITLVLSLSDSSSTMLARIRDIALGGNQTLSGRPRFGED